jgi:hypothetical protein
MNFRKFAQLRIISKKKAPDKNEKHTHFFDHVLVHAGKGIRSSRPDGIVACKSLA